MISNEVVKIENEIISTPNNQIAIICKRFSNENNTYTVIPISVTVGHVDSNLTFHSENGEYHLNPIDRVENITDETQELFYVYSDTIETISQEYKEKDVNKLMMRYYMDIASHINLALVDGDIVKVYHQDYTAISKEISGGINKHYEEKVEDAPNINYKNHLPTEVDLEHIDKNDLSAYLKRHIFANDSILDNIATVIAMNYSAKKREDIVSTLSIGNTGCGKTETFKLISEYLGVPFTMFDCSSMSKTGFQGNSIEDLIKTIYNNGKDKIALLPKSIVVLEEIDKIANRGHLVSDVGVQYELLKFLDGFKYYINVGKTIATDKEVCIDTTFMTKAALGAFEEMWIKKQKEARRMGFNSEENKPSKITEKDIIDYGIISQLLRRFLLIFQYKDLLREDLRNIILKSESSPLLIKKRRYLEEFNTILEYTEDYIEAILDYTETLQAGAGGLNKAVLKSLIKADGAVYDRLFSKDRSIKKLRVTAETVENPCKFTY